MRDRLVIFDCDGTLADAFPWYDSVFDQVATRYRFRRLEGAEREALRDLDAHTVLARLGVARWKLPFIARHVRALKARSLGQIGLFPGIADLLQHLAARGITLAIVSSDSERNVRTILGSSERHVRHFACGASLLGKRAKFRHVLRAAGARPNDALCIGDEIRDLDAARSLGLAFGGVTWGFATADALSARRPDILFSAPADIARYLAPQRPGAVPSSDPIRPLGAVLP